jgi:fumarylacetoacetate (FAA) hydrolase family protein
MVIRITMSENSQCSLLADDLGQELLLGRVWRNTEQHDGPCVVVVRDGEVFDITATVPTTAGLFDQENPAQVARAAAGVSLGDVAA